MVSLALFRPDQAGNCGTLMRLSACMDIDFHIIHPCGFTFSKQALKRSAMDYFDHVTLFEHDDFDDFCQNTSLKRKILLTTKTDQSFTDFTFEKDDILILGQESAGAPDYVHDAASSRVTIPMHPQMRSINIAISASMVLGEALRQTGQFPK